MNRDVLNFQKEPAEGQLRLVAEKLDAAEPLPVEKQFVNFMFLRVDPEWRKLDHETKHKYKVEFEDVFNEFSSDLLLYSYSLVGFDSKADLMFWRVSRSLDVIQDMTARLYRTGLGGYIETTDNYLSVTKRMIFVDGPPEDRLRVRAGSTKYHFIYPSVKNSEWYKMSAEERDAMIEENFMVGKKFPNIKIHLTHAFGFADNEYLISFETDDPQDFLSLAEELRNAPSGKFTPRGMPVYTCRQRSLMNCLDALG